MKILLTLIALTTSLLLTIKVQAQSRTADSIKAVRQASKPTLVQQKQLEHEFYKRQLKGDSVKAQKVQTIMESYKAEMRAVEKDVTLNTEAKRGKFQSLIEDKNQKLEAILNPQELEKFVPPSERKGAKGPKKN